MELIYGLRRARKYSHATILERPPSHPFGNYSVNLLCTGRNVGSLFLYPQGGIADSKIGIQALLGLLLDTADGAGCRRCITKVRKLLDNPRGADGADETNAEDQGDTVMARYTYVCGPMAGKPNLNRAAFDCAALVIVERGDIPVLPHDIAPYEHPGKPCPTFYGYTAGEGNHDPGCFLRGDIAVMVMCDSVYRLKGWEDSKGANVETNIALQLGIEIEDEQPWPKFRTR